MSLKWWTVYEDATQHLIAMPKLPLMRPKFSLVAMGWGLEWAHSPLAFMCSVLLYILGSIPAFVVGATYLGGTGAFIFMCLYYAVFYPTIMYWFIHGWIRLFGYKPLAEISTVDSFDSADDALEAHKYYAVLYALNTLRTIVNNPYKARFIPLDKNYYNKLANAIQRATAD